MAVDNIFSGSNPAIYKLSADRLESIKNGDVSLNIWEKFKDLFRGGAKQKMIETVAAKLEKIEWGLYSDELKKLKTFETFREFAKPEELSKFKIDIQHKINSQTNEKSWSYSFIINDEIIDGAEDLPYNINGQGILKQFEAAELTASITSNLVNILTNPRGENPPKDDVDSIRSYVSENFNMAFANTYRDINNLPQNGSILSEKLFENLFDSFQENKTSLFNAAELSYHKKQGRHEKQVEQDKSRLVYRPEIRLGKQIIGRGAAAEPIWQQLQNERIASFSAPSSSKDLTTKTVKQLTNADVGARHEAPSNKGAQVTAKAKRRIMPNMPLPKLPKPENLRPTIPLPEIPTSKSGA